MAKNGRLPCLPLIICAIVMVAQRTGTKRLRLLFSIIVYVKMSLTMLGVLVVVFVNEVYAL